MQNLAKVRIVILAAGLGTRMKSEVPKALTPLFGEPIIKHLLKAVKVANIDARPIIVIGHKKDEVVQALGSGYEYAIQEEQLGTAHALLTAKENLKDAKHIVVLYGDQPSVSGGTLKNLVNKHLSSGAKITLTTARLPDYADWRQALLHFGRILRKDKKITGVHEYKETSAAEKNITEINAGHYVFEASWLWANLNKVGNENSKREYYLPTLFEIAEKNNEKIESIQIDPREALGANSKEELEILEKMMLE